MRADPSTNLAAYVPTRVVPDQDEHFLASSFEPLGAPRKKARGYPAHRATVHKTQPRLFEFGHIEPVAGDGLRIWIVLRNRLLYQTQRFTFFAKAVQVRLGHSGPPAFVTEASHPIFVDRRQLHQSVAASFFLAYRGSGEVIQRFALCQR